MDAGLSYQFFRAWGETIASGVIRQTPEDFRVIETLSFSPSGEGDHIYLLIEKTGANTDWVAAQLANLSELKSVDIGYAGLKDRHAVTRQWFSLHMPNQPEPDWAALPACIRVLSKTRHEKKLKTGAIKHNDFELCVRQLKCDKDLLTERLSIIQSQGVPNYFGPQRFGRNNANVRRFIASKGNKKRIKREQRGILISAARSYLFNHILSQRISMNNWNQIINGDVLMLDGSRSIFVPEQIDAVLQTRLTDLDIHPCGPLWGSGRELVSDLAARVEKHVIEQNLAITSALENVGASLAHRAMRVGVRNLSWKIGDEQLKISFSLMSGSYATSVLREFLCVAE